MHRYGPSGTTPDARVAELAAGDWGVVTRNELRACGLTDRMISARVRAGRLHRVHVGVYAVGHAGLTMRGRFLAAVKACGEGAALSHVSAAAVAPQMGDALGPRDLIQTARAMQQATPRIRSIWPVMTASRPKAPAVIQAPTAR